ncbi:MAG: glycogen synthase GlgA [bacterium]
MNIVMIASEAVPYAKTGGLADVVGTLPRALSAAKEGVALILPYYRKKMDAKKFGIGPVSRKPLEIEVPLGGARIKGTVLMATLQPNVRVFFIDQPAFFDREELYQTATGDYPDNAERFIFFSRAAIEAMIALDLKPDIVHVHDWQAALVPVYLKTLYKQRKNFAHTRTVLTIHNLGYQGLFPKEDMPLTGLGWDYFTFDKLEYWGKVGFLKGGIAYADEIGTVSRKYAEEILTEEQGLGLQGALAYRKKALVGILNGIDYEEWNPEGDRFIAAKYKPSDIKGKATCKEALRKHFGLKADATAPIIGMVGRLTIQKGLDILADALPEIMKRNVQLAILGTGEQKYHDLLTAACGDYPNRIGLKLAFDNALAHQIEAGSDFFLMPSHYEPCGLNQLISLKYGTIPIVRATGGLDDSIVDFNGKKARGNGFKFTDYTPQALIAAIDRALDAWKTPPQMKSLISNAMSCDFSWKRSAKEYIAVYERMLKR